MTELSRRAVVISALVGASAGAAGGAPSDDPGASSPTTFGAKCDGETDDTAAVQRCVDHCLRSPWPRPMIVPGPCLIRGTVYIDLPADNAAKVFWIICCGPSAGFKRLSAGPLFDTLLPPVFADDGLIAPVSHYLTFHNALFQGNHADALILSPRFLRVTFLDCTTSGQIRYVDAPRGYLQSFRWERCRSQGGRGWLASAAKAYDLYWDVTVERGGGGLHIGALRGGYVTGQMESSSGPMIDISGATGLTVAIRYTEANEREDVILGREGGACEGVTFVGGCYQPSTENARDPSFYNVRLGRVRALTVSGYCSGRFFDDTLVDEGYISGTAFAALQLFRLRKNMPTEVGVKRS